MNSTEPDKEKKNFEHLAYVKPLLDLWAKHRGNFYDVLRDAKSGVWADCPAHSQVYLKTLYFDRVGRTISRNYRRIDGAKLLVRLEKQSVTDIENLEGSTINSASEVAQSIDDDTLNDSKYQSFKLISLINFIFSDDSSPLSSQSGNRRFSSTRKVFVFVDQGVGEAPLYTEKSLNEINHDVVVESLRVVKNDYQKISGKTDQDENNQKELISKEWLSQSLMVLNDIAFKYKGYDSKDDNKGEIREAIKEEISSRLSVHDDQKLNTAFDMVSDSIRFYRKGLFGKSEEGKIYLLEAVNILAEIDFNEKESGIQRKDCISSKSREKDNEVFKKRNDSPARFKYWVENELKLTGKYSAAYKHISEFIRN